MSKTKSIAQRIWARVRKRPDSVFDADGRAQLDPTPMAIPTGMQIPESLDMKLARLFRQDAFRRSLEAEDLETFEESQDFGFIDRDDDQMQTVYQQHHMLASIQAADRKGQKPLIQPFDEEKGKQARERVKKAGEKPAEKTPAATAAASSPSE